jgi:hypothetical protein
MKRGILSLIMAAIMIAVLVILGCSKNLQNVNLPETIGNENAQESIQESSNTSDLVEIDVESQETAELSGIYVFAQGEAMKLLLNGSKLEDCIVGIEFLNAGSCNITYGDNYNGTGEYTMSDDQVNVRNKRMEYIFLLDDTSLRGIAGPVKDIVYQCQQVKGFT